ncbi:MAG: hypothetical protein FJ213_07590 [Ignavibacteria bacterium]|nr:hypothetical protein [Ignavibacteria bacterium]
MNNREAVILTADFNYNKRNSFLREICATLLNEYECKHRKDIVMPIKLLVHSLKTLVAVFLLFLGCKDITNSTDGKPPCGGHAPGIVPAPAYDSPIWHPSGKFIGFNHTPLVSISYPYGQGCWGQQHFNGDSTGFWLINSDGTNKKRVFPYTLQTPAWSPDGKWISFVLGAQIFKMRFTGTTFDTTTLTQLTFEGRNFFPAWSPDGQWIAYDSNSESPNGMNFIWLMRRDGSEKRRIIYEPSQGEIRMPHWSSEGARIVHIRYLVGTFSSEIFTMDSSGASPRRLTVDNWTDRHPRYSTHVTTIAYLSNSNIWIMDSTGNNRRQLTTWGVDGDFGLPFSWSPDGSKIIYTRYQSTDWTYANGTIWVVNVETGEKQQLTFNLPRK